MAYKLIAAADLGSNSFRLEIGRVLDGQIYPLDSLKDPVRLASGLNEHKHLDLAAQERALAALRRFGERLRGFQPEAVRAVGTNALRVAKNAADFLPRAEAALGFPIEIIAGREEARLIYLGVVHSLPPVARKRLVVDIGGGSTELIIGKKSEPLLMESLYMGCVSYTLRFFPEGKIDKKSFRDAEIAAALEIETIASDYLKLGWVEAIGSSGSARAIVDLLEMNQLNPAGEQGITRVGLHALRALLIKAGAADRLAISGLRSDRLPVLPGGIAIMCAIFAALGLERMYYAEGALRLGVLYDLLGRVHHHDMRDATVLQFMRRYQVDARQAERVERTALALLGQLIPLDLPEHENDVHFLTWAARLHEIGLSIAHNAYHKHGAYILNFADMPGFSKSDQARLAMLVLGLRGKLEKLTALPQNDPIWRLVFCLRTASILHRSRDHEPLPELFLTQTLASSGTRYQLEVPADWLADNPLTAAIFVDELAAWQKLGSELRIKKRSVRASAA
ncbi:MAG: exopolyphosphatase [Pseudomonadota bacterium]